MDTKMSLFIQAVLHFGLNYGQGSVVPVFVIQNEGRCIQAIPPRRIKAARCPRSINGWFQWRWTMDGQVQNIESGLCVDVDTVNHLSKLRLSKCFFRKSYQKFHCEGDAVFAAHSGYKMFWRFVGSGESSLSKPLAFKQYNNMYIRGTKAKLCDLGHRDVCLQTIGKIPAQKGSCLVLLNSVVNQGYVVIAISGKPPLRQLTISFWIKSPPQDLAAVFSYVDSNNMMLAGMLGKRGLGKADFFFSGRQLKLSKSPTPILSGEWTHVAFTWSKRTTKFAYYINGDLISTISRVRSKLLPGTGTLRLGRVSRTKEVWFSGFISEFNIYGRVFSKKEMQLAVTKLHCCGNTIPGDWLSWRKVLNSGKMFGNARQSTGEECISFEELEKNWKNNQHGRWNCRSSLFVADPRFIPDNRFTSSSSTLKETTSNGRASYKMRTPWCPGPKDYHSYLQVDLGGVKKLTAIGTGMLKIFRNRYAKKIKFHYSVNGMVWKTDKTIYNAKPSSNLPSIKVIPLSSAVTARYVRFYPISCAISKCCLSVEVFGCEAELDKRISEGEDGCASKDKPYILMDLGELQRVKRIQITSHRKNPKNPVRKFYIHYMSWNYWVPYQIQKKLKIFKGSGQINRPFSHVLPIPIVARLIKIFPVPYGHEACAEFLFIGCPSPRLDFCDLMSKWRNSKCLKDNIRQCKLGFVGDGITCQDFDECEAKHNTYCDQNSICKNKRGLYECTPCKNSFIGDGKVCQTPCEALGIFCSQNSFCDLTECRCDEGYVNNGTHCEEESEEEKNAAAALDVEQHIAGSCPDGYFNCYGDVIGALEELKRAILSYANFDEDECDILPHAT